MSASTHAAFTGADYKIVNAFRASVAVGTAVRMLTLGSFRPYCSRTFAHLALGLRKMGNPSPSVNGKAGKATRPSLKQLLTNAER